MPYNGNGQWIPPSGNPVQTTSVIASSWANTLVTDIANSFGNTLTRDGQSTMTAALKIVDGTVTIPGLSFNSEASTGFYRPGAGLIAGTVLGVEVFRYGNAGRFLLGTTSDDGSSRLQVAGPLAVTGTAAISGNATVGGTLGVTGAFTSNTFSSSGATLTGGSINGMAIGGTTPSTGAFTTLSTTGAITLPNNTALQLKDLGGTARNVLKWKGTATDIYVGDMDNVVAGSALHLTAQNNIALEVNSASIFNVSSTSVSSNKIIVSSAVEAYRATNDSALISFYNTASSTRTGYIQGLTGSQLSIISENGANLVLGSNGSGRLTVNTAGNVGLGVTPTAAWGGSMAALEVGSKGNAVFGSSSTLYVSNNVTYDGANWRYSNTGLASLVLQSSGAHQWYTFASGNAGATANPISIGQFDQYGNLLIGQGSSSAVFNSSGRGLIEINGPSTALLGFKVNGNQAGYVYHSGGDFQFYNYLGGITFGNSGGTLLRLTSGGLIQDGAGNELGYKGLPQTLQSAGYTLTANDRGKQVYIQTTGNVYVPTGVFNTGDVVTIINGNTAAITLVQNASVVLYQAGTTNTGNRSIQPHGICTIVSISGSNFFVSGNIS